MKDVTNKVYVYKIDSIYRKLNRISFDSTGDYWLVEDIKDRTVFNPLFAFCENILETALNPSFAFCEIILGIEKINIVARINLLEERLLEATKEKHDKP